MERIYAEVVCNYNNGDGFWTVDAWYPNNENGTVIAVINEFTGGVYAINDLDENAKEVIDAKVKEIQEEQAETLASYYNSMTCSEKDKFLELTGNH